MGESGAEVKARRTPDGLTNVDLRCRFTPHFTPKAQELNRANLQAGESSRNACDVNEH
jgi:hypothetical protein